jgi:hypothetical protein
MIRSLLVLAPILAVTALPVRASPLAQAAPACPPGQPPQFDAGFAALQARLGTAMGTPTTCAYPDPTGSGDVEQNTSVGLAFWRKSTNTPTFTDGYHHWGLTAAGMVTWTGNSIDPPAAGASPVPDGGVAPPPAGAGAAAASNISRFVGVWEGHARRLEVHADGSASMTWASVTGPDLDLALTFTTATPTVATGRVVASNSPLHPVGEAATLTLNSDGTVSPTLGGDQLFDFCGPRTPAGYCGA